MNRRLLLPAIVTLLVLGVAFVLGQSGRTPQSARTAVTEEIQGLGYTARDVLVEQTDAAGQLQYSLQAGQVDQASEGAPIVAQALTLQYEPLDKTGRIIAGRRWTVTANSGELPEETGVLQLAGNVAVRAQLAGAAEPMTIRTEALSYDTGVQRLSSASDVAFLWGRQQLQGRGMKADIRAGTLALESSVHGRLSP